MKRQGAVIATLAWAEQLIVPFLELL